MPFEGCPALPPLAAPGNAAATRERIVASARPLFAERGFEATTVHAIARSAQVSPNLITRYFDGKNGLFLAASSTAQVTVPGGAVTYAEWQAPMDPRDAGKWTISGPGY